MTVQLSLVLFGLIFTAATLATPLMTNGRDTTDFPLTCEVRKYNFTAVQTDRNGKKCREQISTNACYGSCNTYEVGDVGLTESDQQVCLHGQTREKRATLNNCDPGAEPETKNFVYLEAVTCVCQECNPAIINCRSRAGKRKRTKTTLVTEVDDGRFGEYDGSKVKKNSKKRHELRDNSDVEDWLLL